MSGDWALDTIHTGPIGSGIAPVRHPHLGEVAVVSQGIADSGVVAGQALVAYGLGETRSREPLCMTGSTSTTPQVEALASGLGVHLSWSTPEGVRSTWLPANGVSSGRDPAPFGGRDPEIRLRPGASGRPFWFILERSPAARSTLRIFRDEESLARAPERVGETYLPAPYHFEVLHLGWNDWLVVSWHHTGVKVVSLLVRGTIECLPAVSE